MGGYPLDQLYEEMAYIAYYLHWPYEDILNLEHAERRRWAEEVAKINERLSESVQQAWAQQEM
ncbi:MAG: hypothetical protein Q7O66_19635 [Dehalococcoidia bacterium]|nr:hypothetical protein [Dehalococcoidia bacterium]